MGRQREFGRFPLGAAGKAAAAAAAAAQPTDERGVAPADLGAAGRRRCRQSLRRGGGAGPAAAPSGLGPTCPSIAAA